MSSYTYESIRGGRSYSDVGATTVGKVSLKHSVMKFRLTYHAKSSCHALDQRGTHDDMTMISVWTIAMIIDPSIEGMSRKPVEWWNILVCIRMYCQDVVVSMGRLLPQRRPSRPPRDRLHQGDHFLRPSLAAALHFDKFQHLPALSSHSPRMVWRASLV